MPSFNVGGCCNVKHFCVLYFWDFSVLYWRLQCVMWFGQTISCEGSFQSDTSPFNTIRLTNDPAPLNFQCLPIVFLLLLYLHFSEFHKYF